MKLRESKRMKIKLRVSQRMIMMKLRLRIKSPKRFTLAEVNVTPHHSTSHKRIGIRLPSLLSCLWYVQIDVVFWSVACDDIVR
jgi:hypothetical protein